MAVRVRSRSHWIRMSEYIRSKVHLRVGYNRRRMSSTTQIINVIAMMSMSGGSHRTRMREYIRGKVHLRAGVNSRHMSNTKRMRVRPLINRKMCIKRSRKRVSSAKRDGHE